MLSVTLTSKYIDSVLDPSAIQYTNEFFLLENLTARLVKMNEVGEYELDLASDIVKISEKMFKIKIKNSSFSNGEKITIIDVKNTLERSRRKGSSHVNVSDFIKSIEVEGDSLLIELKRKTHSFFYYLSLPDLGILHKSQLKDTLRAKDFSDVSSGPYRYEKRGEEEFFLVKNPHYSLSKESYPGQVELIVPFQKDDVQDCFDGKLAMTRVPLTQLLKTAKLARENKSFKLLGHPSDNLSYLFFNQYSKRFKNKSHRRWLAQLIHKHIGIPNEFSGFASKANQYFHSASKAYLSEKAISDLSLNEISRPLDFPKKIVIKAGVSVFDVTFEPIVRQLERIPGVEIEIQADLDFKNRLEFMKEGTVDLFFYVMSTDYRVPVEAIGIEYFSSVANLVDETGRIKENFLKYQESESEREAVFHLQEISKQMIKDAQVIPLFHSVSPYLVNADLVDVTGLSHIFVNSFWKYKAL